MRQNCINLCKFPSINTLKANCYLFTRYLVNFVCNFEVKHGSHVLHVNTRREYSVLEISNLTNL